MVKWLAKWIEHREREREIETGTQVALISLFHTHSICPPGCFSEKKTKQLWSRIIIIKSIRMMMMIKADFFFVRSSFFHGKSNGHNQTQAIWWWWKKMFLKFRYFLAAAFYSVKAEKQSVIKRQTNDHCMYVWYGGG